MTIEVELKGLGADGQIREVQVPNGEWHGDVEAKLDRVYHYGQNDFQPQAGIRSVSVGDIIHIGMARYRVEPIGFEEI